MGMKLNPELETAILTMPGVRVNGRPWGQPATEPPSFESEKEFQAAVQDLAKRLGWKRQYHTRDSRKSATGFPDLVLVRERVVWAELKTEYEKPTADQLNWIEDLRAAGQEVYLWKPADWSKIEEVLR